MSEDYIPKSKRSPGDKIERRSKLIVELTEAIEESNLSTESQKQLKTILFDWDRLLREEYPGAVMERIRGRK